MITLHWFWFGAIVVGGMLAGVALTVVTMLAAVWIAKKRRSDKDEWNPYR